MNATLSILFKQPLLLIGHTGNSKTMCIKIVEEALQSIVVKDKIGIHREKCFRFLNYQAANDLTEDDLNKIVSRA